MRRKKKRREWVDQGLRLWLDGRLAKVAAAAAKRLMRRKSLVVT